MKTEALIINYHGRNLSVKEYQAPNNEIYFVVNNAGEIIELHLDTQQDDIFPGWAEANAGKTKRAGTLGQLIESALE